MVGQFQNEQIIADINIYQGNPSQQSQQVENSMQKQSWQEPLRPGAKNLCSWDAWHISNKSTKPQLTQWHLAHKQNRAQHVLMSCRLSASFSSHTYLTTIYNLHLFIYCFLLPMVYFPNRFFQPAIVSAIPWVIYIDLPWSTYLTYLTIHLITYQFPRPFGWLSDVAR